MRASKRLAAIAAAVIAAGVAAGVAQADASTVTEVGAVLGAIPAAGTAGGVTGPGTDISYHGGPVLTSVTVQPIFWGPKWSDPLFAGDKVSGLKTFYDGMRNSGYAATSNEYTDSSGAHVTSAITGFSAALYDASAAPTTDPGARVILNEVARVVKKPAPNTFYAVYSDTPLSGIGYCAWHSWGSIRGVRVTVGWFPNIDNVTGCTPNDLTTGHSAPLAALANVSGHELSEVRTDPFGTGWYDGQYDENADKCAWAFGSTSLTFSNGSQWRVQGNWSNAAHDANGGYPNNNGELGCLDGGNFK